MTTATLPQSAHASSTDVHGASYQAFQMLHWGFVAVPLLAGIDKFFNLMTQWDRYLSPAFAKLSPFAPRTTMTVVGVIEIVAALFVAVRPKIGSYVVAAWMAGTMLNLLLLGRGYDIALRDLGLCVGALALGRLSELHDHSASFATRTS